MNKVTMKGKTVEEAIKMALEVLKLERDQVDHKVLEEAEGGVLGMFGKEAEVEVWEKQSLAQDAIAILQQVLDKMGFITIVDGQDDASEEDKVCLNIRGEDMGRIIGKEGNTLDSLQYIITLMMSKKFGRRIRVIIDAEGYREKNERRIRTSDVGT